MHRPGTTILGGRVGFEAESDRSAAIARAVAAQAPGAGARARAPGAAVRAAGSPPAQAPRPGAGAAVQPSAAFPVTMARVPSGRTLPCTDDPDLFFAESPEDVESAKDLCRGCAARLACLAGALERREPWGVWGGEVFLRGEIVPRKRPRGRPRKDEEAA